VIFYFSATGNSLQVAGIIGRIRGDRMVSIGDSLRHGETDFDLTDGETAGIVCPVYFYGLPLPVEEFIGKVSFNGKRPSMFLVLTFGTFTGTTGRQASKLIAKRGFSLDKIFSVPMPENYIPLLSVPNKERRAQLIRAAEENAATIADRLGSTEGRDCDDHKGKLPSVVSSFSRPFYVYGRRTRRFHATQKCNGCGKCSEICPDDAIRIVDGRPVWVKERCYRCLACIHRCPMEAIEFGRSTVKKERYVNPTVRF